MLEFQIAADESGPSALARQELEEWIAFRSTVGDLAANAKLRVNLNVGGRIFATTPSTVAPSAYLSSAIARWKPDLPGSAYYLDHSPQLFAYVMACLRIGSWPSHPPEYQIRLTKLSDYLGIKGLGSYCTLILSHIGMDTVLMCKPMQRE